MNQCRDWNHDHAGVTRAGYITCDRAAVADNSVGRAVCARHLNQDLHREWWRRRHRARNQRGQPPTYAPFMRPSKGRT